MRSTPRPARKRPRTAPQSNRPNLDALVDEIRIRLSERAFAFDDPGSYTAGIEESTSALRDALPDLDVEPASP